MKPPKYGFSVRKHVLLLQGMDWILQIRQHLRRQDCTLVRTAVQSKCELPIWQRTCLQSKQGSSAVPVNCPIYRFSQVLCLTKCNYFFNHFKLGGLKKGQVWNCIIKHDRQNNHSLESQSFYIIFRDRALHSQLTSRKHGSLHFNFIIFQLYWPFLALRCSQKFATDHSITSLQYCYIL